MNNSIPGTSPLPPWSRPSESPTVQVVTGDDIIQLGADPTYINQITPKSVGKYNLVLPNGTYLRQVKRIYVIGANAAITAPFTVSGVFAGFQSLLFNTAATAALLEWDGTAWQLTGGNVQTSTTVITP